MGNASRIVFDEKKGMHQVEFRWKRSSDLVYLNQGKKKVERRKIEMTSNRLGMKIAMEKF